MKFCSKCNSNKDESEFYIQKRRSKPARLSGYCKQCMRANYLTPATRAKQKAVSRTRRIVKQNKYSLENFKDLVGERWVDIPDYEGFYQVSTFGRVRSIKDSVYKLKVFALNKKLGYIQSVLCKNGVQKTWFLHRVIAITFIPNPNSLPEVNHIDGVRSNNNLSNLEWVTHQQNMLHAIKVLKRHGALRKLNQPI